VPNLNNIAHVGGLVAGAVIALCLPTRRGERTLSLGWRTQAAFSFVLALSAVSVLLAGHNLIGRLLPPA